MPPELDSSLTAEGTAGVDRAGDGAPASSHELQAVYAQRFSPSETLAKQGLWSAVAGYLQRYVPPGARVIDIASDAGFFLQHISAAEKVATDIRDTSAAMPAGVRFVRSDSLHLGEVLPANHFDVVFMSNFLEHLPSGEAVIEQFRVVFDLLRSGGRVIVLQPNIRLTKGAYWDFIDHKTPLTERSLEEAAGLAGFRRYAMVTRFLPFTTKSRLPQGRRLVRLYLAFRPAWWLLGKQTLYVAEKP
jgi:SAM-dependent methyltransferase